MNGMASGETTTYTVRVPGWTYWATGNLKGQAPRKFEVEEEFSILGSLRAIKVAYDRAAQIRLGWSINYDASPQITPNPAAEGGPVGTAR